MLDVKLVDWFTKNVKLWKLIGVYPFAVSHPLLYGFYRKIFLFFFIFMYSILFTVDLYFTPKNVNDYVEQLILYFTVLSIMCKVLTILFKKEKIKNIIHTLDSDIFQPCSDEEVNIINEANILNRRYFKTNVTASLISNLVHIATPLFNHLVFKTELFLPVCSYFFLSDNIKTYYIYPLYFYQCIGMHIHVLFVLSMDTFFVGLTILLIAQLEILENKFINVTEHIDAKTQQNDADLIKKLNKIFIRHGEVTKFCNLIEEVFSVTLFVHFGMGSYIICMCLIRFTMPAPWQYFIFLSTYTFAMIVQIFIPCWFGTRIMDKSCQLGQAIYNCDWTPRSKRFKSSLLLFVERTKRPLSITGWKMFLLSLTTFTSIMNTAYSFFTVLRQMQSK